MSFVKEFTELFIEIAETVAEESFGSIRIHRHYSGRAMYGEYCFGITIGADVPQVELGAKLMRKACETANQKYGPISFPDDVLTAMKRARTDSMGRGTIVYFPGINDPVPMDTEDFV